MTKRKSAPFHGGWMNPNLTESEPMPSWLPESERTDRERAFESGEAEAAAEIMQRIRSEPGDIEPEPVIAVLRDELARFRFNRQWQDEDPEPKQWNTLLRKIHIPDVLDFHNVDALSTQCRALPAHVIGVLNGELFKRAGIGCGPLFVRMMKDATDRDATASQTDADLLRSILADMIESLRYVRGKPGRQARNNAGSAFRALVAVIMANAQKMKETDARALAAELLANVGIPISQNRQNLSKLAMVEAEK